MNELYHFGVPGMRWGVRRYQNVDGSLTSRGRKRFKEVSKSSKEQERVRKESLKLLGKDLKRTDRKYEKVNQKFEKTNEQKYADKAKAYLSKSKDLKTKISNIDSGSLKAGKDYVTTKGSIKIPYVYIGLTRPKLGVAHIPRHKVVFTDSKEVRDKDV